MPKYAGFNPRELEFYRERQARLRGGGEDLAVMLYNAIQASDPNMEHAFTPEVAEEACRRAFKNLPPNSITDKDGDPGFRGNKKP